MLCWRTAACYIKKRSRTDQRSETQPQKMFTSFWKKRRRKFQTLNNHVRFAVACLERENLQIKPCERILNTFQKGYFFPNVSGRPRCWHMWCGGSSQESFTLLNKLSFVGKKASNCSNFTSLSSLLSYLCSRSCCITCITSLQLLSNEIR